MGKFDKNQTPLTQEVAEQMLSNVFAACEYEGNRVPLEVLLSYSHYRRERYLLQKIIIILVLAAFLLMPILFVTAEVETRWMEDTPLGRPVMEMEVSSFLPIDSITASIDGYSLEVYQAGEGVYQIHPDRNGNLLLTVTLANKQYTQTQIPVDSVDMEIPQLIASSVKDGMLTILLEDNSGTLDFEGIYAMDTNGNTVRPLSYDTQKNSVTFEYPHNHLNIFVPDPCNNILQLVLTVQ